MSFPEEETSVIWAPSQLQGQRQEFGSVLSGSAGHRFRQGEGCVTERSFVGTMKSYVS